MSYFRRPGAELDEQRRYGAEPDEQRRYGGEPDEQRRYGAEPDEQHRYDVQPAEPDRFRARPSARRRRVGAQPDADHRYDAELDALADDETGQAPAPSRPTLGELSGRVSRWFQGLDADGRDPDATVEHDVLGEPMADDPQPADDDVVPRFPLGPFGYNRAAVDEQLAALERQLAERERELVQAREAEKPPMSITEEIERIGEQTASILVVAHDQAHETTRRAQEQADRCIADAAANAVTITAEAKQRLRELDDETDVVWRERERLLEDARGVSVALASLVDEAVARFPADSDRSTTDFPGTD